MCSHVGCRARAEYICGNQDLNLGIPGTVMPTSCKKGLCEKHAWCWEKRYDSSTGEANPSYLTTGSKRPKDPLHPDLEDFSVTLCKDCYFANFEQDPAREEEKAQEKSRQVWIHLLGGPRPEHEQWADVYRNMYPKKHVRPEFCPPFNTALEKIPDEVSQPFTSTNPRTALPQPVSQPISQVLPHPVPSTNNYYGNCSKNGVHTAETAPASKASPWRSSAAGR